MSMRDPRDYKLDLTGISAAAPKVPPTAASRAYLRIFFECCKTYTRVYRSAASGAFDARCPKCGRVTPIR